MLVSGSSNIEPFSFVAPSSEMLAYTVTALTNTNCNKTIIKANSCSRKKSVLVTELAVPIALIGLSSKLYPCSACSTKILLDSCRVSRVRQIK